MQHFEYQKSKHKIQIFKYIYVPFTLIALTIFYLTWTFIHFSWQELYFIGRNALIAIGPICLLLLTIYTIFYWSSQYKQSQFPTLKIAQEYLHLEDGLVHEIVYFKDMHSIRLLKAGTAREAIQIRLNSGQHVAIHCHFPISLLKPILSERLNCHL
jgi:hypothetical protein